MSDLRSRKLIVLKGALFAILVIFGSAVVLSEAPTWRAVAALLIVIWASARFYYFLFYVLEKYVDPRLKYSGILALVRELLVSKS